jgi:hypothetical protein
VKAIASGNPAVLTLAEADAGLQRLAILRKNHADEQYIARETLRDLPDDIKRMEKRLAGLTGDCATLAANDAIPSQEAIANRMKAMPDRVSETYRTRLGTYRGLEASLILPPLGGTEICLDGATRCRETLLRDSPGPRAVPNALERLADGYRYDIRRLGEDIAVKPTHDRPRTRPDVANSTPGSYGPPNGDALTPPGSYPVVSPLARRGGPSSIR